MLTGYINIFTDTFMKILNKYFRRIFIFLLNFTKIFLFRKKCLSLRIIIRFPILRIFRNSNEITKIFRRSKCAITWQNCFIRLRLINRNVCGTNECDYKINVKIKKNHTKKINFFSLESSLFCPVLKLFSSKVRNLLFKMKVQFDIKHD